MNIKIGITAILAPTIEIAAPLKTSVEIGHIYVYKLFVICGMYLREPILLQVLYRQLSSQSYKIESHNMNEISSY